MNSAKKKAIAGITSVILGAALLPLVFSSPASGATNNGTATLTQSSGTGATNFTINLGGTASCPGDGNAGYRWQTFMIPAAADIDATLTFGSSGPTTVGSEFRVPLYDTTGSPVVSELPDIAVAPATTGGISGIPNFNFLVFPPNYIPDGDYNIGVACTLGAASATQLKSYWSQQITITNDASNVNDSALIDWVTSTPPETTTTTAAPTTTTTAAPTTTTTAAPTTTTTAAPTTTTTAAPTTTTTAAPTTTTTAPPQTTTTLAPPQTTTTTVAPGPNDPAPTTTTTVAPAPGTPAPTAPVMVPVHTG